MVKTYSNSYADVKNKKQSTPDCNVKVSMCTLPTVHNTSVWAQTEAQRVYVYNHRVTAGASIGSLFFQGQSSVELMMWFSSAY